MKDATQPILKYEVITQEDPETGDLIIPIPPHVLTDLGWKEGDQVKFEVSDGKFYISKA